MEEKVRELMENDKRVKVAYCHCGKKFVQQTALAYAETDNEIKDMFTEWQLDGHKIDILTLEEYQSGEKGQGMCNHTNCKYARLIKAMRKFSHSEEYPSDFMELFQAVNIVTRQGSGLMWDEIKEIVTNVLKERSRRG